MGLAERFEEWAKEYEQKGFEIGLEIGIKKGIEQSIEKGKARMLQRQLVRRFGALPDEVVAKIATATTTTGQIDTWVDRVLDAATLDEVFRP